MATLIPYSEFIGSHDPYPVIESTPQRIADLTADLKDEQLTSPPQPGKWSIHQIVAHLADTELVCQGRVRFALFEDTPPWPAYDQERWVNGWTREQEPWNETFERFRILRRSTVRLFRGTPNRDLRRTAVHSERGVQSAGDYLIIFAGHDLNHLRQISAIASAYSSGSTSVNTASERSIS